HRRHGGYASQGEERAREERARTTAKPTGRRWSRCCRRGRAGRSSAVNSSEVAQSLANVFSLIVPEAILLVAACVLFLGSTFRADRYLWGIGALGALAAAIIALYFSASRIPSIEARQEAIDRAEQSLGEASPVRQEEQVKIAAARRELETTVFTSP